jgi:hypothetical protein
LGGILEFFRGGAEKYRMYSNQVFIQRFCARLSEECGIEEKLIQMISGREKGNTSLLLVEDKGVGDLQCIYFLVLRDEPRRKSLKRRVKNGG